jgi:large subunit ribosomal protein L3
MKSIIGRKMGMTEVFASDGTMYPVTVVEVLPNAVIAKKTKEKDGYEAIQVGYEDKLERSTNKAEKGIFKKANVSPKQHLYELKGDEVYSKNVGETITCDLFKAGEVVDVIGTTKGHGYSGTIKRYHHIIGPKGHGSGYHRQIGSLANNGRTNNRVIPGKTMSGHWGPQQATLLNVTIVEVNAEKGYILIKGGLPGPRRSIVMLRTPIKVQFHKPEIKALYDVKVADAEAKAKAEAAAKAAEDAKKAAEEKKKADEAAAAAKAEADRVAAAAAKERAEKAAAEAAAKPAEAAAPAAEAKPAEAAAPADAAKKGE